MRLKELRKLYGVSQEKLAKEISVSRSTVAMWESEKSQPDNETLSQIANFFDVTTDYLLGNDIETNEIQNARKISKKLYEEQNIDIATIEEKLGTKYGTFRTWIDGYGDFFNNVNGLSKLANLFHVSLDYLLGHTDDRYQKPGDTNIKFDEFTYAMYNESKELSDDDKQRLLNFARMLKDSIAKDFNSGK